MYNKYNYRYYGKFYNARRGEMILDVTGGKANGAREIDRRLEGQATPFGDAFATDM